MLIRVEILYEKKLIGLAKDYLIKAEKIALQKQKLYYLIEVSFWRRKLNIADYKIDKLNAHYHLSNNEFVLEQFIIERKLQLLQNDIFDIFIVSGQEISKKINNKLTSLINQHLSIHKESIKTDTGKFYYYYFLGCVEFINQKYDIASHYFHQSEQYLSNADITLRNKVIFYSYYVLIFKELKKNEEIIAIKTKLEQLISKTDKKKHTHSLLGAYATFFNNYISCQIELLYFQNIFIELNYYHSELMKYASVQGKLIHHYYKVIVHFCFGEYHQALKIINLILLTDFKEIRKDVLFFAKIMFLIVHFELKNFEILNNYAKMFLNDYTKENRNDKLGLLLLELFAKNDISILNKKQIKNLFTNCYKTIIDAKIDEGKTYFHITAYLTSKIENRPFAEVVRENHQKKFTNPK